jgi:hypothetical protein
MLLLEKVSDSKGRLLFFSKQSTVKDQGLQGRLQLQAWGQEHKDSKHRVFFV